MTNSMNVLLTAAQGETLEPEAFQRQLIDGISKALIRQNQPPCLLRAPTGSGKTFMLARVLANVSASNEVVWFWFVPFVNLVAQTLDALAANATDLTPQLLAHARNQEPSAGQVMISTVQAVAKAQWRLKNYDADGDDDTRTMAALVALARERNLRIGMVVDEAHIALDKTTEFGKFAHWLNPDYLIMATATPKDQRLIDFLANAGKSDFESFAVSRDDVVQARLNKRYIEAIVYDLRQSVQTVADLEKTVLRQAWRRNQKLKRDLAAAGIPLVPLLLVQVANGDKTVEDAEKALVSLCKVPIAAIGKHTADEPDPGLMTAIANDASKEVLIFKQSAGTGFDAPRAFVLASTKPVNDADFAMQFVGRVMRVAAAIRRSFPVSTSIPPDFDTAYIYLGNADAQKGFEAAVQSTARVKSQLEGQTEKLVTRETASGATVITNKTSDQRPLIYDLALPLNEATPRVAETTSTLDKSQEPQGSLFNADTFADLDLPVPLPSSEKSSAKQDMPETETALFSMLGDCGLRSYKRSRGLPGLPDALKREERPLMMDMSAISHSVAAKLEIPDKVASDAVKAALNRLREIEKHTELTTLEHHDEQVLIVTDRNALAREARGLLSTLPQVEDEDCRIIQEVISRRLLAQVQSTLEEISDEQSFDDKATQKFSRDAANWVIKRQIDLLAEAMHEAIAGRAETVDAGPLPDAMLFPASLPLTASRKNIYGALPPSKDELGQIEQLLMLDERAMLKDRTWSIGTKSIITGQYDGSASLNGEELAFAQALDRSDFVLWWHRNPDRKPYSVRLVRGEHRNYFHPDFIVCLEHYEGDDPILRLIETKENVKDAARKSKHVPDYYGRVLFLTKDQSRLRWVNEDGSMGESVDLDDLHEMREWLRKNRPTQVNQ